MTTSVARPAPAPPGTEPAAEAPAPETSEGQAPAEAAVAPPSDRKQAEAWWRARITDARDTLRQNRVVAEALQSRINALTTDFVNRDDPVQRAVIAQQRREALAELDRVHRDIEAGQNAVRGIEEEARQAGVPPGWLR